MITIIIGARPQFIKHQPLQAAIGDNTKTRIVHTGQHYDLNMSDIFFQELGLSAPDIHLGIGSDSHAKQTGKMLMAIEQEVQIYKPKLLIVYGDTNSTLAGTLASVKLGVPVAHIEAGLRSFNRTMPEEINRIITDRISQLLFVPSELALDNLKKEGITTNTFNVGDIMYDTVLFFESVSEQRIGILDKWHLSSHNYYYATIHRASNTDNEDQLLNIIKAFSGLDKKVLFPIHPRTKKMIKKYKIKLGQNIIALDPAGYLDSIMFIKNAKAVLTDSGGMQKEAFYLKTPCITIRTETEWPETIEQGWNQLVDSDEQAIIKAVNEIVIPKTHTPVYGDGKTAMRIKQILSDYLNG
jgi:UDP-N-acetylglucosamine 2-epimerase